MTWIKDLIDYISKLFTWWIVIMPWEQGIRVTLGKKTTLLNEGVYLKLPLLHTVYLQEKRLRVINLPIQTISSQDGFAITIGCSIGYSIIDITKLYNSLYQPDMTLSSIASSHLAKYISSHALRECNVEGIESYVNAEMKNLDYGLKYEYIRVVNFAVVKTFRLIQDQSYSYEGTDLNKRH